MMISVIGRSSLSMLVVIVLIPSSFSSELVVFVTKVLLVVFSLITCYFLKVLILIIIKFLLSIISLSFCFWYTKSLHILLIFRNIFIHFCIRFILLIHYFLHSWKVVLLLNWLWLLLLTFYICLLITSLLLRSRLSIITQISTLFLTLSRSTKLSNGSPHIGFSLRFFCLSIYSFQSGECLFISYLISWFAKLRLVVWELNITSCRFLFFWFLLLLLLLSHTRVNTPISCPLLSTFLDFVLI